jgi:hypothetical protein
MRPVCKFVRPTPSAIAAVKERMQSLPYFTYDAVADWFIEFDPALAPLNASKAAAELMRSLRACGVIHRQQASKLWLWRAPAGQTERATA